MVFAYRLTDNWDLPSPTYQCSPLVYGTNALAVGIPISWAKSGSQWRVSCIISSGVVTGVTALDSTLVSVVTAGSLPIVRDGIAMGTSTFTRTTIATVLTDDNPHCCYPRFRVAQGRRAPLLETAMPSDPANLFNVTTHQSGAGTTVGPTDQWYAVSPSAAPIATLPDIMLDIARSPEGLRYLSPENTFYDWQSLRTAKDWILAKGYNLAGQYWGRQSFVRFLTELAAQSGCILARKGSSMALIPEQYGIPRILFTAANTNDIRFHRNSWHRHLANRVSSDNSRVRVVQQLPGLRDTRNDPAPSVFPAEWVDDALSLKELQKTWIDSIRRQDLEVDFLSTTMDAHQLGPGDLIQVISPNLEQTPGEGSGYTTDAKPSWEGSSALPFIYQKDGARVVGTPGVGTFPAARTNPDTGVFRVVEMRPVDAVRIAIRAVIRPSNLGAIDLEQTQGLP